MSVRVTASCRSDDNRIAIENVEVTSWFEQATDEEIIKLWEVEFGGDYPADDIASFIAERNQDIQDIFDYLAIVNKHGGYRDAVGFECYINEKQAMAWIQENRPILFTDLDSR